VFVPLRDENPLRVIQWQWVTVGIIALNVIIFGLQLATPDQGYIADFAAIPSELLGTGGGVLRKPSAFYAVPEPLTLITYQFLHGSPMHLIGNMLFLRVFGDNVEDAMGHVRFLAFYLLCGVAGGLAHAVMTPSSDVPLIGASGAVAGVISAYLILHPKVRVWVLAFRFIPLRITAAWALGAWIATQFVMLAIPDGSPVAWWAHIGGILAGALLIVIMRRPGVPLFDQGQRTV
jgi:membrane associated rhomboid family serine protease